MTRSELLKRLRSIGNPPTIVVSLIEDIEADGVLDVQAPPEIAKSMNLPRPAK